MAAPSSTAQRTGPSSASVRPNNGRALPLTQLAEGQSARLLKARLAAEDGLLLNALGLTDQCRLRLCKSGDPWIVQVRATRIGLAESVARNLLVLPEPRTESSPR